MTAIYNENLVLYKTRKQKYSNDDYIKVLKNVKPSSIDRDLKNLDFDRKRIRKLKEISGNRDDIQKYFNRLDYLNNRIKQSKGNKKQKRLVTKKSNIELKRYLFLMGLIFCELLIILFSNNFYQVFSLSKPLCIILAITIEFCFMISNIDQSIKGLLISLSFLSFSIFTTTYSIIDLDENIKSEHSIHAKTLRILKDEERINQELINLSIAQLNQTIKQKDVLIKREWASSAEKFKGSQIYHNSDLKNHTRNLKKTRKEMMNKLNHQPESTFLNKVKKTNTKTQGIILFFILIQLASLFFSRESLPFLTKKRGQ